MADLDKRFRIMDAFPGYRQIPSLASPPPEAIADPSDAVTLACLANDAGAEIVARHPDRFPSFVATLPLSDPAACHDEMERAVRTLGARGVQIFTSVNGHPVDGPAYLALFHQAAELGCAIWLHPVRPLTAPDYPTETVSKFDLWWAFGWPQETSLAMGRLVFSGLFDRYPNLVIITHHVGGTVPLMGGRLGCGLDQLGTRTPPQFAEAIRTPLQARPLDAFRQFHADTASFGSREAIECGRRFFGINRLLFASDMPFDPEQGPGHIRETLAALQELDFTPQERQRVLAGNARRVLNLQEGT